jgi:hypothetical protein
MWMFGERLVREANTSAKALASHFGGEWMQHRAASFGLR